MVVPALRSPLTESQVEELLRVVCVDLGLCLTPDTYDQLVTATHTEVSAMTNAILVAEGLSPQEADSKLYARVRECVEATFAGVTASVTPNKSLERTREG
jgi:hypothetical protein